MNFERARDMLAWQWCRNEIDYELMLSVEPDRWALPLCIEHGGYEGRHQNFIVTHRTSAIRILCVAIHFTWDRATETVKVDL